MRQLEELPKKNKSRYEGIPVYTGRLKRAKAHPDIRFRCMTKSTALYYPGYNSIELHVNKNTNEDYVIDSLLHELDHWASRLYISNEDFENHVMSSISIWNTECPFIEYFNFFPGHYDFEKWEKIYHRGVKEPDIPRENNMIV